MSHEDLYNLKENRFNENQSVGKTMFSIDINKNKICGQENEKEEIDDCILLEDLCNSSDIEMKLPRNFNIS